MVPDQSKYVDQQTLKLQENPEVVSMAVFCTCICFLIYGFLLSCGPMLLQDVPTGELPRNMLLSVDRHLVQTIVPGTRLTIMGIYSIFQSSNSSAS